MGGLIAGRSFVKVMPHDYKRVLSERAQRSEADGAAAHAGGNGGAAAQSLDGHGGASAAPREPEQERG